jgi:hypothetical protein
MPRIVLTKIRRVPGSSVRCISRGASVPASGMTANSMKSTLTTSAFVSIGVGKGSMLS